MSGPNSGSPVVVGSDAAIDAALWAIEEAVVRDTALRLISAVPAAGGNAPAEDLSLEIEYAETALRNADAAVATTDSPVKTDTAIVRAAPRQALIDESRSAAMVCVGSVGIGRVAAMLLGSTAAAVANAAHCPVAIIRSHPATSPSRTGSIVVAISDSPDNEAVVEQGFTEAALRGAGLIAVAPRTWRSDEADINALLDCSLDRWTQSYPDVPVQAYIAPEGIAGFVAGSEDPTQLAVVGSSEAADIIRFVGPVGGASLFDHAECSVLVVRR
jgi:nucleotide-binding universal stress UspA family protein